jgi:hypothetical protein
VIKCTICYAWQPKNWDGSRGHWSDEVAMCEVKGKFTCNNESCEIGKIVRPPVQTHDFRLCGYQKRNKMGAVNYTHRVLLPGRSPKNFIRFIPALYRSMT